MTQILHRPREFWQQISGLNTANEITQQPAVWLQLSDSLIAEQQRIEAFLGDWLLNPANRVILTGAGSSAYCGEIVADEINAAWPAEVRAIPSTSLLTHPDHYLDRKRPTMLVSFARSGNSPESQATVDLLRKWVDTSRFVNITCNENGELALQGASQADTLNILMPAASCDQGFAMTSSFTSMLLTALTVFGGGAINAKVQRLNHLAALANQQLRDWAPKLPAIAEEPYARIVYLGSGPLEALAKEAALKVLELTGGRVLAMANTSLGFRHGPKSAVNGETLVVAFQSNDPHAQRYDQSLLEELRRDQIAKRILSVGPSDLDAGSGKASQADLDTKNFSDPWLAPLWLLIAQQIALHMSAALGLTPDNPFPDGTVNRVVQGVTIYSHGTR